MERCSWQMGNDSLLQTQEKTTGGAGHRRRGRLGPAGASYSLPAKRGERWREAYRHPHQGLVPPVASETRAQPTPATGRKRAQDLAGRWDTAGPEPSPVSLTHEAAPGPFTVLSIHSANHVRRFGTLGMQLQATRGPGGTRAGGGTESQTSTNGPE